MEIKDKRERVNAQYKNRKTVANNPSLVSFLKKEPVKTWMQERLALGPWAELGCGDRSLFEDGDDLISGLSSKSDLWAFDLSDVAIERAKNYGRCFYESHDLVSGISHGPYSVILDGHFLHCLSSLPEVYSVLGHILRSLRPGGIYIGEVMTAHKALSFESDLYYDYDQHVLFQGDNPIRTILEARQWEDLFASSGLEIAYFVCQASIKMIPISERAQAMNGDPECLRFILKRPENN